MGPDSVNWTQLAAEVAALCKITLKWRLFKVIDFDSDRKPASCTVFEWRRIGQIIVFDKRVPLSNSVVRGETLNCGLRNLV